MDADDCTDKYKWVAAAVGLSLLKNVLSFPLGFILLTDDDTESENFIEGCFKLITNFLGKIITCCCCPCLYILKITYYAYALFLFLLNFIDLAILVGSRGKALYLSNTVTITFWITIVITALYILVLLIPLITRKSTFTESHGELRKIFKYSNGIFLALSLLVLLPVWFYILSKREDIINTCIGNTPILNQNDWIWIHPSVVGETWISGDTVLLEWDTAGDVCIQDNVGFSLIWADNGNIEIPDITNFEIANQGNSNASNMLGENTYSWTIPLDYVKPATYVLQQTNCKPSYHSFVSTSPQFVICGGEGSPFGNVCPNQSTVAISSTLTSTQSTALIIPTTPTTISSPTDTNSPSQNGPSTSGLSTDGESAVIIGAIGIVVTAIIAINGWRRENVKEKKEVKEKEKEKEEKEKEKEEKKIKENSSNA